uniref:hypothetical protein n=1 Tax=Segatella baroniae TaxID=305719 RepID=UPI003570F11C
MGKVVFGTEVVSVIGFVDLLNIIQELFEWLSIAILIKEQRERLIEFVKSLESGENIGGLLEAFAHRV